MRFPSCLFCSPERLRGCPIGNIEQQLRRFDYSKSRVKQKYSAWCSVDWSNYGRMTTSVARDQWSSRLSHRQSQIHKLSFREKVAYRRARTADLKKIQTLTRQMILGLSRVPLKNATFAKQNISTENDTVCVL